LKLLAHEDIVGSVEHETQRPIPEPGPGSGIFERLNNYLLLLYAGACLLMYFSLSGLLYLSGSIVLSLSIPGLAAIVFPLFVLSRRFSLRFADEYRLGFPALEVTVLSLLISAGMILPIEALSTFVEKRWPPDADYIKFLIAIKPKGMLQLAAVGAGIALVTPVAEELLFRGVIQRIFSRNMDGPIALALASLLFALCHFDLPSLPAITALGLVYGYLFLATGNLFYPILGHALFNLFSLIRLYRISEEDLQSIDFGYPPFWFVAVSLAVVIACALRLRHRRRPE
jgi:membrane protease YdiL (CAAX protease family)